METVRQTRNEITEGVIWKRLLLFFFPILLGTFFQRLYNTIDSVIVGQFVGKEALASVGGSSAQIVSLVVGFFTGLSSGAAVTIAQFTGAKKEETANAGLHNAYAIAAARRDRAYIYRDTGGTVHAPAHEYTGSDHGWFPDLPENLFRRHTFCTRL